MDEQEEEEEGKENLVQALRVSEAAHWTKGEKMKE